MREKFGLKRNDYMWHQSLYLLIFFLTFSFNTKAQFKWETQNLWPTTADLMSIWPLNSEKVITGGIAGELLISENGGTEWIVKHIPSYPNLKRLYFSDSLTGWFLALNKILITTDGGYNWEEKNFSIEETKYFFMDIKFTDKKNGWLLLKSQSTYYPDIINNPGLLFRTTDSGGNWERIYNNLIGELFDLACFPDSVIYILSSEAVSPTERNIYFCKSTDGGLTWKKLQMPFSFAHAGSMQFVNEKTGWIYKYKTTDGGGTWQLKFPDAQDVMQMDFYDINKGWAINDSTIFYTGDGGENWIKQFYSKDNIITSVKTYDGKSVWASGYGGTLLKTMDSGKNWNRLSKGVQYTLNDVTFINPKNGYAAGDNGTILHSNDGGENWIQQQSGVTSVLRSLQFIDTETGWIVGDNYILKTTNGGKTWEVKFFNENAFFRDLYFFNANQGFVIAWKGYMFKTADGGETWNIQKICPDNLLGISFPDMLTGYICGDNGIFFKTTDGGISWEKQSSIYNLSLNKIQFLDKYYGWVASSEAMALFRTTNGGYSWMYIPRENIGLDGMGSFYFLNKSVGYASSFYWGHIKKTSDGGITWFQEENLPVFCINDIKFNNEKLGWAVGSSGAIFKFYKPDSVSGIIEMNNLIKPDYKAGVFPNPFNSTTRIHFTLNNEQPVSIYVYNALGQPVIAYPEKHYSKGENEIIFKADGLPSGIYFIRLVCKEYQKSIKCLLLK